LSPPLTFSTAEGQNNFLYITPSQLTRKKGLSNSTTEEAGYQNTPLMQAPWVRSISFGEDFWRSVLQSTTS